MTEAGRTGGLADLVVPTSSGRVRGTRCDDARVFLNIPYAAAPLGELRFASPYPHSPWDGVRDASRPGPNAPQPPRNRVGRLDLSPFFGDGWEPGEDYLTLNVWAPVAATTLAPVVVFVHGGAFVAGSTRGPLYDGAAFARDGVVFVTVNYRLGVPGFLRVKDAPDNRGRLDILAALRWIQRNAARFGGDHANVTLSGQSAGGIIVSSIVGAQDARGLLRRAIIESGGGSAAFSPEQAGRVTAAVGHELEIEPSAPALGGLTDEQILDVLPRLGAVDLETETDHDPLGGITRFSLVLDRQPADRLAEHGADGVDLLIGSNRDESTLYLAPFLDLGETTEDDVRSVAARFHPDPDRLVQAYRSARPSASAAELRSALLGDGMFGVGTRRFAEAHSTGRSSRTFVYEFSWRSNALDGQLGACHLMELPFVFDRTGLPALHGADALLGTAAAPADLAARMHAAWVRFASDGDPGWSRYLPNDAVVQEIGPTWTERTNLHAVEYGAWDGAASLEGR